MQPGGSTVCQCTGQSAQQSHGGRVACRTQTQMTHFARPRCSPACRMQGRRRSPLIAVGVSQGLPCCRLQHGGGGCSRVNVRRAYIATGVRMEKPRLWPGFVWQLCCRLLRPQSVVFSAHNQHFAFFFILTAKNFAIFCGNHKRLAKVRAGITIHRDANRAGHRSQSIRLRMLWLICVDCRCFSCVAHCFGLSWLLCLSLIVVTRV